MTTISLPPNIANDFREPDEIVEILDSSGKLLGFFHPVGVATRGTFPKTPFSIEELQKLRQQKGGRPLIEILADLERSHPS
jgi:hypothetical protein